MTAADDDQINLLNIDDIPYIMTRNKLYRYDRATNKLIDVNGFKNIGTEASDIILKAETIDKHP